MNRSSVTSSGSTASPAIAASSAVPSASGQVFEIVGVAPPGFRGVLGPLRNTRLCISCSPPNPCSAPARRLRARVRATGVGCRSSRGSRPGSRRARRQHQLKFEERQGEDQIADLSLLSLSDPDPDPYFCNASAPPMTSNSSLVILPWRARLYVIDSERIRSPAFSVAAFMATIRAICSPTAASKKHLNNFTLKLVGTTSSKMLSAEGKNSYCTVALASPCGRVGARRANRAAKASRPPGLAGRG